MYSRVLHTPPERSQSKPNPYREYYHYHHNQPIWLFRELYCVAQYPLLITLYPTHIRLSIDMIHKPHFADKWCQTEEIDVSHYIGIASNASFRYPAPARASVRVWVVWVRLQLRPSLSVGRWPVAKVTFVFLLCTHTPPLRRIILRQNPYSTSF